jgi:hypothetical protein
MSSHSPKRSATSSASGRPNATHILEEGNNRYPFIIIRGSQVYEHDGDVHRPRTADILIEGARIVAVDPDLKPTLSSAEVIDASDQLVMRGLMDFISGNGQRPIFKIGDLSVDLVRRIVTARGGPADGCTVPGVYVRQPRQKIEPDPECPRYILAETGIGYRMRVLD